MLCCVEKYHCFLTCCSRIWRLYLETQETLYVGRPHRCTHVVYSGTCTYSNICGKHEGQTKAVNFTKEIEKTSKMKKRCRFIYQPVIGVKLLFVHTLLHSFVIEIHVARISKMALMINVWSEKCTAIWWTQSCCKRKNTKTSASHRAAYNHSLMGFHTCVNVA